MSTPDNRMPPPPPPVVRPVASAGPALLPGQPGPQWEPFTVPGCDVRLWRHTGPIREGVPEIDPDYHFREDLVREFAWATWPHDQSHAVPTLLVGPSGTGKTSLVEQIAARANVPVLRTNMNVGTTVRHLMGRIAAADGSTIFIPGIATLAMETGSWLLLDEISGATPPVALALFPVLEPGGSVLLVDAQPVRYVKRHRDFRVFGTDNTIGAEQEEGRFNYGGTNPDMNEALLNRFGSTIQVGFMPPLAEHGMILRKVPGMDPDDLEGMIRFAKMARESGTPVTISTRTLLEWARRVAAGRMDAHGVMTPGVRNDAMIMEAAGPCFLTRIRSKMERDAVIEMIRRLFEAKP